MKFMKYKRMKRYIRKILLFIMIVCLIQLGQAYISSLKHKAQQSELLELTEAHMEERIPVTEPEEIKTEPQQTEISEEKEEPEVPEEPVMLAQYQALYAENSDMIGWLSIEGTQINYPVMQCGDDEYYLHHDFYGEESKYGCLYVRGRADVDTGTNFVIYGHNMKDGSMFGELDLYWQESFYLEHPTILFDTLYEKRSYEIIAVFPSQVYKEDDDIFKYYQFYEAENQEEFEIFYKNIKELSLYDTGVEASFGDTLLTLSTCAYHVTDGRFVVVAKRVE